MRDKDSVAVVVIGHNEGTRLRRCLESVLACDWPVERLELIYVDSASTDDSCEIATQIGARVVAATVSGAAAARNAGWQACSAEWVMFLDGDTLLAPHFLKEAMQALLCDATIACVWGHRRERMPRQSPYVRVLDLDWRYPPGDTLFCGGDALFRRAVLRDAGGYDPRLLAGEEPELCARLRRMGWRIVHLDTEMTQHDLAITHFRQYWRRAVRAGYAYAQVSRQTAVLWQGETRHALVAALIVAAVPVASAVGGWLGGITLALLPWGALSLLMLRSAWRARWRSNNLVTLLCYGVHSWFEQLPVAVGILRCRLGSSAYQGMTPASYKEEPK